jgi:hypothetical protein
MRFSQPRPLTVAQQFVNLRSNPVCAGAGTLHAGHLVWGYSTSPTPMSRDYQIRIDYRLDGVPRVFVDGPDLSILADDHRLPHVYEQKPPRLCLYLPGTGEWARWMRIDQTIVPWAALWLFYFEDWLISRDWKGGGMHPEGPKSAPDPARSATQEHIHV